VDQSLTFDGVFEMAPHPMYLPRPSGSIDDRYSVGYAFYYVFYLSLGSTDGRASR